MIPLQNIKVDAVITPQAITDNDDPVGAYGDTNPASIDTAGYHFARVIVQLGATDVAAAALALYSGPAAASGADDSTYSLVTGTSHSGSTGDGRLPQATDDDGTFVIDIDLRDSSVGRFLAVDFTAGNGSAGTFVTATVLLSQAVQNPVTNAERGIDSYVHATLQAA